VTLLWARSVEALQQPVPFTMGSRPGDSMPYSDLTSFQFERGKGYTEESVLAFRVLALNVIDDLIRGESLTVGNFPLSQDEIGLVLDHRALQSTKHNTPTSSGTTPAQTQRVAVARPAPRPGLSTAVVPTTAHVDEPPRLSVAPRNDPAARIPAGSPAIAVEDEFAIAARWLALATRSVGDGRN
jgi:hypothetical protein